MDFAPVNGEPMGGGGLKGYNAFLTGGLALAASIFSAGAIISASLDGGIENTPGVDSYLSYSLLGGIEKTATLHGEWFITAMFRSGCTSNASLESDLGRCDALNYGAYSFGEVDGTLDGTVALNTLTLTHTQTTAKAVGCPTSFGGLGGDLEVRLRVDAMLQGNIQQVSDIDSPVMKIGCAMNQGASSSPVFAANLIISPQLWYGPESTSELQADMYIGSFFAGGVFSDDSVDDFKIAIAPALPGGVDSASSVGGEYLIDAGLMDGPSSDQQLSSELMRDASLGGFGAWSSNSVDSTQFIDAVLSGGTYNTQWAGDFSDIKLGTWMVGGIDAEDLLSSQILSEPNLSDGLASSWQASGDLMITINLDGGISSAWLFSAPVQIDGMFSGSTSSNSSLGSDLILFAQLDGSLDSGSYFGGVLWASPQLSDGVSSGVSSGGDIVQGFKDPLLNTSALGILSATEILSLVHPYEDI